MYPCVRVLYTYQVIKVSEWSCIRVLGYCIRTKSWK